MRKIFTTLLFSKQTLKANEIWCYSNYINVHKCMSKTSSLTKFSVQRVMLCPKIPFKTFICFVMFRFKNVIDGIKVVHVYLFGHFIASVFKNWEAHCFPVTSFTGFQWYKCTGASSIWWLDINWHTDSLWETSRMVVICQQK